MDRVDVVLARRTTGLWLQFLARGRFTGRSSVSKSEHYLTHVAGSSVDVLKAKIIYRIILS